MGGIGILLIAVGAILAFAVSVEAEGVDLETVGVILMAVGAIAVVLAMIRGRFWGMTTRTERAVSPDGSHVVEQTHVE